MQNTHDILVGPLSISIPSKAIYYYYFTLVGYEIVIAIGIVTRTPDNVRLLKKVYFKTRITTHFFKDT